VVCQGGLQVQISVIRILRAHSFSVRNTDMRLGSNLQTYRLPTKQGWPQNSPDAMHAELRTSAVYSKNA
jgi:catalase (peroxidase I)